MSENKDSRGKVSLIITLAFFAWAWYIKPFFIWIDENIILIAWFVIFGGLLGFYFWKDKKDSSPPSPPPPPF